MSITCGIPTPIPENASVLERLDYETRMQGYILHRIQSARNIMEALAVELSKHSLEASRVARNMVLYGFRDINMGYLAASRFVIKELSNKITPEMLITKTEISEFDRIFNTFNGAETVDNSEKDNDRP